MLQDVYKGVSYNISNNPCKVSQWHTGQVLINSQFEPVAPIGVANTLPGETKSVIYHWVFEKAEHNQLSICLLVQVAAAADSDKMMQAGTRMERIFRSMFMMCKCNANGSACFQEKTFNGQ
jgi:hypothetical protein